MPNNLLITLPRTRINDLFVDPGSSLNFFPIESSFKDPLIQGNPNSDYRFYADFYKKIGIDIVAETVVRYPYPFITEKTYRPIACGRPFIIVGPYKTLDFLRSFGFVTFSSIIDESYDNIYNTEQRFTKICQIIKKFVDRPIEQIISDVKSVKDSLEHNRKCLENLAMSQFEQFKKQIKID